MKHATEIGDTAHADTAQTAMSDPPPNQGNLALAQLTADSITEHQIDALLAELLPDSALADEGKTT